MGNKDLHIGIIPDGSRRWGRKKGKLPNWDGKESGEKVTEILTHILDNYPEIAEVTIWAMSTENFERNQKDKRRVFKLIENTLNDSLMNNEKLKKGQIRIKFFGSKLEDIPQSLMNLINKSTEYTRNYSKRKLNIAHSIFSHFF